MSATREEIAHFWSEWTDDMAPLREHGLYLTAAADFLLHYTVTPKEGL